MELQTDLFQKVPPKVTWNSDLELFGVGIIYSGWELLVGVGIIRGWKSGLEFGVWDRMVGGTCRGTWSGPAHLDLEMFPTRLLLCGLWGVRFRVVHRQSVVGHHNTAPVTCTVVYWFCPPVPCACLA